VASYGCYTGSFSKVTLVNQTSSCLAPMYGTTELTVVVSINGDCGALPEFGFLPGLSLGASVGVIVAVIVVVACIGLAVIIIFVTPFGMGCREKMRTNSHTPLRRFSSSSPTPFRPSGSKMFDI